MSDLLYPVRVLYVGDWMPEAISTFKRNRTSLPSDVLNKIENRWRMAEIVAREKGNTLTRGGVRAGKGLYLSDDNSLCLKYVESDYGNVIGSTYPDVPEEHQERFVEFMCVTTTWDGYVVYGVRGPIDWSYQCHVAPAGRWSLKQASPAAGIVAEFEEELGVHPDEIQNLRCIGVVADETHGRNNFEFVFAADVPLTFIELRQRAFSAKSANEHIQLLPVCYCDIGVLIESAPYKWVPTGFAGLALWYNTFGGHKITWSPDENVTYDDFMKKSQGR